MPLVGVDLKGAGQAVGSIATGLGDFALKLRSAITGKIDPTKEAELLAQAAQIELVTMQAQTKINEIEAANPKLFISGWRPAVGWLCAVVLAFTYVVRPILTAFKVPIPEIAMSDLWPVLTGMLGIGGMRTYEKIRGVAGNH